MADDTPQRCDLCQMTSPGGRLHHVGCGTGAPGAVTAATYSDPSRFSWEYFDNLCKAAERFGTRNEPDTAAHIERLRRQIVARLGERQTEKR